jgi:hypothetical protein
VPPVRSGFAAAIAALLELGIVRLSTDPLGKAFVKATVSCCWASGAA